ncbi:MAG: glycosyltransferase family 2 protein [Ruminococcaceae bacterium]|nr:glycosyltransferase family 2 protein [Oscillospiraceae bacterium]
MKDNPLVSVIIPVYNTEKYVRETVFSVLNQSYKPLEVLLIVDASPDGSFNICRSLADGYDNVFLYSHEKNRGLSAARNTGLIHTTGEYVLFLDSDDTLLKNVISDMVEIMENSNSDAVYPKKYVRVYQNDSEPVIKSYFDEKDFSEVPVRFAADIMIEKCCAWGATAFLYRRETLEKNNLTFTDGITAEDIVFNLAFLKCAGKIAFYNGATECKLKRKNSITVSYNQDFKDNLFFIYDTAIKFLIETGHNQADVRKKSSSLLSRSIAVYITNIMSDMNPSEGFFAKSSEVKKLLSEEVVKKAFSSKLSVPYFEKKTYRMFFVIMYSLIKMRLYTAACFVARVASKRRRR